MTTNSRRQYEMLLRVSAFADSHRHRWRDTALVCDAFDTVGRAVTDIGERRTMGVHAGRKGAGAKLQARRALERQLVVIARAARVLAPRTPGVDDVLRLPRPRSDDRLVAAGRLFVRELPAYERGFLDCELPGHFIADLRLATDQLDRALAGRRQARQDHAAARAQMAQSLAAGRAAVGRLDVMLRAALAGDPATLAAWTRASRVDYSRRTRRK